MAQNYEFRFELKPGKFVYIQRSASIRKAREIIARVEKRYAPDPIFFHIGRRGGHVAALHMHQKSQFFSRFDITNFFGNVTRSKLTRALRKVGFSEARALDFAVESVVVENGRKIVPFGFCQSPLMATLVLERSLLGVKMKELANRGFVLSVYMDDILVSGDNETLLEAASRELIDAADGAGFPLSAEKFDLAVTGVDIFNCHLKKDDLTVLDERMSKFVEDHALASEAGQGAIEKYIEALSTAELSRFQAML